MFATMRTTFRATSAAASYASGMTDDVLSRGRLTLDLFDFGYRMMRTRMRRELHDENAVQAALVRWLQHRPGAVHGDYPGPASTRQLGRAAATPPS